VTFAGRPRTGLRLPARWPPGASPSAPSSTRRTSCATETVRHLHLQSNR